MISAEWYVTVQHRLPGRPVTALDGPLLDAALRLVELQAGAGIPAGDRDFTGYIASVLFDDWDEEWADAPQAGLRCLISYRAISGLAHYTRERQSYGSSLGDAECGAISAILDRLQETGYGAMSAILRLTGRICSVGPLVLVSFSHVVVVPLLC